MDRLFSYLNLETLASDLVKTLPFDYVVESILKMAENEGLEEETRDLAIESLVSLLEAREWEFPAQFVSRVFAVLMRMMLLDAEDHGAYYDLYFLKTMRHLDDCGESRNLRVRMMFFCRLADALGGNTVFPVASDQLPAYLAATDWRKHHAALVALAQISQGCSKAMIRNSEQVVTMVLNSSHDPHPLVRWAAMYAVAQLSINLGPDLQVQYHARVLPALASVMDDVENPLLQAHAASAVTNFSEDCTPDILTPYLDGLVSKLLVLLQSGIRMLQKEALSALASVAVNSSQEQFQKYYDEVMPCLKARFVNEYRMLAQAMECICSVGMAVGKDKFRDDAKQVIEVLMSLEGGTKMETADFTSYMRACGRLCKCLGQDFLPYMELVMPRLLECAQDEDEHFFLIEERATACKVLCCIADDLKEGFFPWIEQVAPILVPLLKDYSNRVRKAAIPAMPRLLRYSKLAIEKGHDGTCLKQLSDYIVPALVKALRKEPNSIMIAYKLEAFNECLQISGPLLDENQVRSILDEIKLVITASSSRMGERAERIELLDFDEELLIKENEIEKEIFDQVGAVLKTLVKAFDSSFLAFFDELFSYLLPMLGKDKTAQERSFAICVFDDVAEQCREAALRFYDAYLPVLLEACNDESSDVRQATAYGLGVCAEYGGSAIKPLIGEALSSLNAVIRYPDALHHDNVWAYDSAVSAFGKICHFHGDSIDSAQVIPAWLNCLPVKGDVVAAKAVHELLSVMVERRDAELLGPNNQYLTKIVTIFIEILCAGKELASDQTISRISNLLRHNFGWDVSCVPDIQQPWKGCFG